MKTREEAARLFEKGYGYKAVSAQLGIGRDTVREWGCIWRALGREGLCSRRRRCYAPEVKLAAVIDHLERGISVADVMVKYSIGNRRQVKEWCKLYKERGRSALGLSAER